MHRNASLLIAIVIVLGVIPFGVDSAAAQSDAYLEGQLCSSDYRSDGGSYCEGGPLPGATVRIVGDSGLFGTVDRSTETDADGWFAFDGLDDGDYTLSFERDGFEPREEDLSLEGKAYIERSLQGLHVTQLIYALDDEDNGVPDAIVTIDGREYQEGETDADGAVAFELTAGHYSIQIRHPEKAPLHQWVLFDGQSASEFPMKDAPERTVRLSGQVTDQDGEPVADARIQIWQYGNCCYAYDEPEPAPDVEEGDAPQEARPVSEDAYYYGGDDYQELTTDADGRYMAKLYPGHANLNAYKEGHADYWTDMRLEDGEERSHDFVMEKFPPKTARIEGRVVDADDGDGLRWISVSIESPRYGIHECSVESDASAGSSGQSDAMIAEPYPGRYDHRCAITVFDDGTFEGMVTPGYSILRVYHQHWQSCTETHDADGSYRRECGPEYMHYVQTLDLAADDTTVLRVPLQQRPGADATLSGYVVDKESKKAIPNVHVSFSNQDSYSHAWAQTDGDGSYKVRIRSGYQQVSVWADGYFEWQGVIDVPADGNVQLDILMQKGQSRYGGCCYYAYEDGIAMEEASDASHDSRESTATSPEAPQEAGGDNADFEDLGGGLGPYDADARQQYADQLGEVKDTPGPAILLVGLVLLGAVMRRR